MVFFDIPYTGQTTAKEAFRSTWTEGSACPEPGWSHLSLIEIPVIRELDGSRSTATLRFEGPDINGEFGEEEYSERYSLQREDVQLNSTTDKDAVGTYAYDSPFAVFEYVSATKRTTAKFSPSLDDPIPLKLVSYEDKTKAATADQIIDDNTNSQVYEVVTISGFSDISRDSRNGAWRHTEFHQKILEQYIAPA